MGMFAGLKIYQYIAKVIKQRSTANVCTLTYGDYTEDDKSKAMPTEQSQLAQTTELLACILLSWRLSENVPITCITEVRRLAAAKLTTRVIGLAICVFLRSLERCQRRISLVHPKGMSKMDVSYWIALSSKNSYGLKEFVVSMITTTLPAIIFFPISVFDRLRKGYGLIKPPCNDQLYGLLLPHTHPLQKVLLFPVISICILTARLQSTFRKRVRILQAFQNYQGDKLCRILDLPD